MKNPLLLLSASLLLSGMASASLAQTAMTPKAQYAADSKQASTRLADDKKLCNDETSSSARLQCRRDAQAEYNKAITAAKARMSAAGTATPTTGAKALCAECAKVVAVSQHEKEGEGGALGIIAGGATGALLGHQVGGGMGKDLATIAGAVGGAYAGKKIEEKVKTKTVWAVSVQYADGRKHSFEFAQDPGFKVGDTVKNAGESIVRQ